MVYANVYLVRHFQFTKVSIKFLLRSSYNESHAFGVFLGGKPARKPSFSVFRNALQRFFNRSGKPEWRPRILHGFRKHLCIAEFEELSIIREFVAVMIP